MAISPPRWASNAVPTRKGWVVGKELVRAQKFTQEQIDEFYGRVREPEPEVVEVVEEVPIETGGRNIEAEPACPVCGDAFCVCQDVSEEPAEAVEIVEVVNLNTMTKAQLIEYAAANNITVNASSLKADILATIEAALGE